MTTAHPHPTAPGTSQDPDELRTEIARTRADMDATLAELEDRVSPSRIKDRQTEKVRSRWRSAKDSVMGSAEDGSARLHGAADSAQAAVHEAPDRVEQATRGNPLAAGLIAFGLGALAGTLLPPSKPEQDLATGLRDTFEEPVKQELQTAAHEIQDELEAHAERSVEEVKATAQDAVETTQQEAQRSAEQVQDRARGAADEVQQQR